MVAIKTKPMKGGADGKTAHAVSHPGAKAVFSTAALGQRVGVIIIGSTARTLLSME